MRTIELRRTLHTYTQYSEVSVQASWIYDPSFSVGSRLFFSYFDIQARTPSDLSIHLISHFDMFRSCEPIVYTVMI